MGVRPGPRVLPVLHVHVRVEFAEHDLRHSVFNSRVCYHTDGDAGPEDAGGGPVPVPLQKHIPSLGVHRLRRGFYHALGVVSDLLEKKCVK